MRFGKQTGDVVTEIRPANDFRPTPEWLIEEMIRVAEVQPGARVLEPCYGPGAIVRRLLECGHTVRGFELEYTAYANPQAQLTPGVDFLQVDPANDEYCAFDAAIMNPPFSKMQSFKFVTRILSTWIHENGVVVSVIPNYILDNSLKRMLWLSEHVDFCAILPKNSFRHVGSATLHCSLCRFVRGPVAPESARFGFIREPEIQGDLFQ